MVFCGKPSGGCHACRSRKTRCDKIQIAEGGCTQCRKAKRTCPGYRVVGELMFRDESSNVVRKFKAREARDKKALAQRNPDRHRSPSTISSPGVSESDQEEKYQSDSSATTTSLEVVQQDQLSVSYSLAPNLEERATSFFAFHYIIDSGNGPTKTLMDRANQHLFQEQHIDEHLLSSMRAVGLAAYSHTAHAPSLMNNAKFQYMKAIQLTNAALRHPEDVKKDSTLMAIQILAVFETVTGCRQRSLKDWIEHVYGAAAVIKLRGLEQVHRVEGRRMLLQAIANILINCCYRGIRLPEHLRGYLDETFKQAQEARPEYQLMDVMVRFADLRAGLEDGTIGPANVLPTALDLDSILLSICANVPPGWEYTIVFTDAKTDVIFDGRYHVYSDYQVSLMWNWLRILRIMLNGLVREILLQGFSATPPLFTHAKYTARFQLATETAAALQLDILASVPQHIGRGNPPRSMATEVPSNSTEELPPITMSSASFLIWPLWFAGNMANATDEIREFTIRNLHSIGNIQGVQQAHVLANLLQTSSAIKVWDGQRQAAQPTKSKLLIQDTNKPS